MESPVLRSMAERSRLRVPRPPPYLIDRSTGADCAPRACDWRGTCRDSTGPKTAAHRRGRGRFGLARVALSGDHRLVPKPRMLSVRAVYVLGSLQLGRASYSSQALWGRLIKTRGRPRLGGRNQSVRPRSRRNENET